MADVTRRDAIVLAAGVGVAAFTGSLEANQGGNLTVPVYLKVEEGITVQLQVGKKKFSTGTYSGNDVPVAMKYLAGEDQLELTEPLHGHKITLTQPKDIAYLLMTAQRDCVLKIQAVYKTAEMNLGICCWQCQGVMVCALPGFCVHCGVWTFCCPAGAHAKPGGAKPHE